jgi:ribonuclease P/MRP protein subunit POP5
VRVSGTIRKAEEEAVRRARRSLLVVKEGEGNGDLLGEIFGTGEREDGGIRDSDKDMGDEGSSEEGD